MAGLIYWRERAIVTLQDRTNVTALTTGSAVRALTADLDVRNAGNASDDFVAMFELLCRWATITGIVAGTVIADLYLVPLLDAANVPDIDLTAGTSYLGANYRVGSFIATKTPTVNIDVRSASGQVQLFPTLYRPYILNLSGQTITTTSGTSWQLRVVSAQQQYT